MDTTELRNLFRAEMSDTVVPYLISDDQVYRYLDDAQKQFCRWTEGIEDARSFTIAIVPTVQWYDFDKTILKLRRITNAATGASVTVINPEKLEAAGIRFDGRTGPLKAVVAGMQKNTLRVWPVPNVAVVLALEVFRLSKTIDAGDELEIDEQHHINLLLWAKFRAYGNEDSDVFNSRKSADYEVRFHNYCAESRKDQERARRVTGTVTYGGV